MIPLAVSVVVCYFPHLFLFAAIEVPAPMKPHSIHLWLIFSLAPVFFTGCAEGVFSGIGAYTPWVQSQWAQEEQIVQSLYGRRKQLQELAAAAPRMQQAEQERVSRDIANLFNDDPIVLLRIEAVRSLVPFRTQVASDTLVQASKDESADVRIAACQALADRQDPQGIAALQSVIGSDTEIDVRLAAARALGTFRSQQSMNALALALDDPDPAMQFRVMESLRNVSGQNLGGNVVAWREFVRTARVAQPTNPSASRTGPAPQQPDASVRF